MAVTEVLILLTTPLEWPDHALLNFPNATHMKVVHTNYECPRLLHNRASWVDFWLAPGIIGSGGLFLELPGFAGVNVRVDSPTFPTITLIDAPVMVNVDYLMSKYAIAQGAVFGTVITV